MLIYSFITDYQAFNLRYKDNTTRDKNETKVDKQSANLGKNNEPIQNRLSFLIDCKSVILHHLAILSFPMVRPAWDNWVILQKMCFWISAKFRIDKKRLAQPALSLLTYGLCLCVSLFFLKKMALSRMVRVAKLNANRDFWQTLSAISQSITSNYLGWGVLARRVDLTNK